MFRTPLILALGGLVLAGCQSNPKQTVLGLDTTDPQWTSERCIAARKTVAGYNDGGTMRAATGVAGMAAGVPVAGAAASLAMNAAQDDEREDLNNKVRAACISDPLKATQGG